MKHSSFSKKRIIHLCVVTISVVVLLLISGLLILKYNVEGEKNIPFKLKNISIISTADADIKRDEEENWHAGILQKNDIFITLEKNDEYKKTDTIKKITIENFKIIKSNDVIDIGIYRPASNDFNYTYTEEFEVVDNLQIEGAQQTNIEVLQINNQGGTLGFSITEKNLGEYDFTTNEKVPSDGKLLAKAGLTSEDVQFTITFDLIIETGNENKFKTNISLELPTGNILEEGVSKEEINNFDSIVFKRVK